MTDAPPIPTPTRRWARHTRRGSAYVLVLSLAMLVLVIGAGAIAAIRAEASSAADLGDIGAARLNALSAIELGRLLICNDSKWRTNRSNGAWATDQRIGDGYFTLEVNNPSGALDRSPTDSVVMTATGKFGHAQHKIQVTLVPACNPLACLEAAVCAGGNISLTASTVTGPNQLIASNANVTAGGASINANVEAVVNVNGGTYNGTTKNLATLRQLPDSTVFDYYIANGTAVSYSSLSTSGGSGRNMTRLLLSPQSNPWGGATNANGIYVLDCQGQQLTIVDSRIVGTLVIINPGSGSIIQGSMNWAPAVAGYPCLLVQGKIDLAIGTTTLSEATNPKVNFNPTGTPYPITAGVAGSDADKTDTFPSLIDGLVYMSGSVTTSSNLTVDMLLVGGALSVSGTITLNYDSAVLQSPPPGFGSTGMAPVPGTWAQSVN